MRPGLRSLALATAGCACLVAAIVTGACVVAPPAELPPALVHRPTILHGSVVPPAYLPLTTWTSDTQFIVPVELDDVNESYIWEVYVDYDGDPFSSPANAPVTVAPGPGTVNGGISLVEFQLGPAPPYDDLRLCHVIEVLVARAQTFPTDSNHRPAYHALVDYDSVAWTWTPAAGCNEFTIDSGSQATDAAGDALPVPPFEAGPGDP
jgi:hypothetical protein